MRLADIEKSVHSQNGEDGIIAYLVSGLLECRKSFVEIGTSGGWQCNTTALAREGWSGVAIDASGARVKKYRAMAAELGFAERVHVDRVMVTPQNVTGLDLPFEPDVFSLDIDGIDWHVAKALLETGFRPQIAVLEYNAAFGPRALSVPIDATGCDNLYFGCSVSAWKRLWEPLGYRFVTVDSSGINAFFVRDGSQREGHLGLVDWLRWRDCRMFARWYGSAPKRFALVAHRPLVEVS